MSETRPTRSESSEGWIRRAIASGALKAIVQHFVATTVIPLGVPVLTGYLAYMEGQPWSYIVLFASVAFGGVTTGLVKFDDWRERRRVNGKLHLVSAYAGPSLTDPAVAPDESCYSAVPELVSPLIGYALGSVVRVRESWVGVAEAGLPC